MCHVLLILMGVLPFPGQRQRGSELGVGNRGLMGNGGSDWEEREEEETVTGM